MKWVRRISLAFALLAAGLTLFSIQCSVARYVGFTTVRVDRDGLQLSHHPTEPKIPFFPFFGLRPTGDWLTLPEFKYWPNLEVWSYRFDPPKLMRTVDEWTVRLPHWLTNLIAWSLFFIVWRKSRKHPEGHCQGCGYNLANNQSGTCPECGAAIAPASMAEVTC